MMQKLLFSCSLLLLVSTGMAQDTSVYEHKYFVRGADTLYYRILYPLNYKSSKQYPLVVFLHGAGERGSDNSIQLKNGGRLFADSLNRIKYPAIVVFPQCPRDDFWARLMFVRPDSAAKDTNQRGFMRFPTNFPVGPHLGMVGELLDSFVNNKHADRKRVYIGGLSMGGMATFEMCWRKPNFFAAAFPICGGGAPEKVNDYGPHFPIWVFHGDKDRTVPVGNSRIMVEALKQSGAHVKYSEYPGLPHNCWDRALSEPDLLPWLFSKSK